MRPATGPSEALVRATHAAARGEPRPLYDLLTRGSHLPGVKINENLAEAFAEVIRSMEGAGDKLAASMAQLDPDQAPGATPLEFLPVCGVYGVAIRAAADEAAFKKLMPVLHACAEDLRFRVRDAVVKALTRIGKVRGDALVVAVAPWMDGYFHAAAVLSALRTAGWMTKITRGDEVAARLDEAFVLARDATRAAFRYPGHKALIDALALAPGAAASRFGTPVFDMIVRWSSVKEPILREVIEKSVGGMGRGGRHGPDVDRVKKALLESTPPLRDPKTDFGPTRRRGTKHKAR